MGNHVLGIATEVIVMAIVISVILLFLGIGVLVLIHVCIVGRTLRRGMGGERNVNMVERGSFGSTSMSQDDIEKLPCFDFKAKEKGSSPAGDCAVCLEKFSDGERCRLLPHCNHSFHADCVDLWLLRTPICPICRAAADHSLDPFYDNGGQLQPGIDGEVLNLSRIEVQEGGEALRSSEREIQARESDGGDRVLDLNRVEVHEGREALRSSDGGDQVLDLSRVEVHEGREALSSSERVVQVRERQEHS